MAVAMKKAMWAAPIHLPAVPCSPFMEAEYEALEFCDLRCQGIESQLEGVCFNVFCLKSISFSHIMHSEFKPNNQVIVSFLDRTIPESVPDYDTVVAIRLTAQARYEIKGPHKPYLNTSYIIYEPF